VIRRPFALLVLLAALLARCAVASKSEILVFAAASLTESLQDLGKAFEAKTGDRVGFSFGASSDLARQIQAGAPADVFFSADAAKMDVLEEAGLVRAADRRQFLSNVLVVVVPASSKLEIRSARDLAPLSRIALADPAAVPAGIYAKKWLAGMGLWETIEPKVVPTLDVRAALAAVESGAVPAAIVYRTDAVIARSVGIALEVNGGPEIVYSLARLSRSKSPTASQALVQFLAGEAGCTEFRRRGFLLRDTK
jgi:molybdate transport system substrate-binding protein